MSEMKIEPSGQWLMKAEDIDWWKAAMHAAMERLGEDKLQFEYPKGTKQVWVKGKEYQQQGQQHTITGKLELNLEKPSNSKLPSKTQYHYINGEGPKTLSATESPSKHDMSINSENIGK